MTYSNTLQIILATIPKVQSPHWPWPGCETLPASDKLCATYKNEFWQ